MATVTQDDLAFFCMLCWAIWEQRNVFFSTGNRGLAETIVNKAEILLSEFRVTVSTLNPSVKTLSRSVLPVNWLAPPPGKLKLNTAIIFRDNRRGRLSDGRIIAIKRLASRGGAVWQLA
ncbi:hypothetical protein Q3G72_010991 [Acer saccharum]|nr:hypothetical protein Q3G72_010991 [Acer saccharum]